MIINNTVGGNGCLTQLQRQRSLLELLQSSPHLLHLLRKGTIIRTCQRLQRKDVSTFCNSFIFIFCIHKLYINTYREQLITYYDFDLCSWTCSPTHSRSGPVPRKDPSCNFEWRFNRRGSHATANVRRTYPLPFILMYICIMRIPFRSNFLYSSIYFLPVYLAHK